jgi:hypothetical protein
MLLRGVSTRKSHFHLRMAAALHIVECGEAESSAYQITTSNKVPPRIRGLDV